jgi:hypothetical protein
MGEAYASLTPSLLLRHTMRLQAAAAANSTSGSELDTCIIRFATARRACYGSDCGSCILGLEAVGADCVRTPRAFQRTMRGEHFVESFRDYRYIDVARQCLRSVPISPFDTVDEVTCGDLLGGVRTRNGGARRLVAAACRGTFSSCLRLSSSLLRAAAAPAAPATAAARDSSRCMRRTSSRVHRAAAPCA